VDRISALQSASALECWDPSFAVITKYPGLVCTWFLFVLVSRFVIYFPNGRSPFQVTPGIPHQSHSGNRSRPRLTSPRTREKWTPSHQLSSEEANACTNRACVQSNAQCNVRMHYRTDGNPHCGFMNWPKARFSSLRISFFCF
jgi:hypothetical protein